MLDAITVEQVEYMTAKPAHIRKDLGQFFTRRSISDYMASMITPVHETEIIRILDAGAGAGILTVSAALQCLKLGHKKVHAVLYEVDREIISLLKDNMEKLVSQFQLRQAEFSFEIKVEDFILARPDKKTERFHIASINPPYFKYNTKTSRYAGKTSDLFKGNPNIYASFMAVTTACLYPGGQMIAIVPRSFSNGLYFKGFRHYLANNLSLENLHIFKSRNNLFKEAAVLQENIICRYVKRKQQKDINIFASSNDACLGNRALGSFSSDLIIDYTNEHNIIRIPETLYDVEVMRIVESWKNSFESSGYFISTGPVVEHRTREFIHAGYLEKHPPLLRMHNVKPFKVSWSGKHKKDASFILKPGYEKHVSVNRPYVILKRFSSKDENRRLIASVHDPKVFSTACIAMENHLNYIGSTDKELDLEEAFGLAALLNSTLMDRYFRCVSGNTQVNATEIRLMKVPDRKTIRAIGCQVKTITKLDQKIIDQIVLQHLNITM